MRYGESTADFKSFEKRQPERVIDYLRVSVTDRCNFRCQYCMPPQGVAGRSHRDILSFEEIVKFAKAAVQVGISRVRVTGGEPLVRRDCPDLLAKLARISGVKDLSLTTNGSLLEKHVVDLWDAGLRRLNISVDSLNPARFSRITRGARLQSVLTGLNKALSMGFSPVKVNAVMLEGIEQDLTDFVALSRELPVHVRFIEFMPIGNRRNGHRKFVPRTWIMEKLAGFGDLDPVDAPPGGGPARYFKFAEALGTIGFISSMSDHFCASCNRLRLTADGRLRNCLFSDDEVDVRPYIDGDPNKLTEIIIGSMNSKRFDRCGEHPGRRLMSQIGG